LFVYAITNDVNDKVYVGLHSGDNLRKRWHDHLNSARCSKVGGYNCALYNAIRKYGEDKFHIIAIWSGNVLPDDLKRLERYYIKSFQTMRPNGYNLTEGGDGSFGFKHSEEFKQSLRGRFVSEETRQKMSRIHKGKTISAEHRRAISEKLRGNKHLLGHIHSPETLAKLSAASTGRIPSEETRAKMSRLMKERGVRPILTAESIEKIRVANTGKKRTPEQCAEIRARFKGVPKSEEHKRKISISLTGRHASEETKRKRSEARSNKSNEVNYQPRSQGGDGE
jgi:group I intron endonuclease